MNEAAVKKTQGGRQLSGLVVSNKMDKTCVVKVERFVKHSLYGKFLRRSSKMHVHDADNKTMPGDIVTIRESKPISKTKTWQLVSIDKRQNQPVKTQQSKTSSDAVTVSE